MITATTLKTAGVRSALAIAGALLPGAPVHAADLQVVLVRHAEKASDDPRDPALSAAGRARAAALAQALQGVRLAAAYATEYRRTRQTATPAAERAGIAVTVQPATGDRAAIDAFAAQLRQRHAGQAVLVVGHSNTVPLLAEALLGGAARVDPMDETEYDRLLVITVPEPRAGAPRLLVARYGPGD